MDIRKADKFNELILNFDSKYKNEGKPIEVSFRKLVPELNPFERATHLIHPYPAKLLTHIPYFFLNNSIYSKENDTILDPFCGSGTVLLESILANRNCLGIDINPLAVLISKVKTTKLDTVQVQQYSKYINNSFWRIKKYNIPNVVNIDYWYSNEIKNQLGKIKSAIDRIENEDYRSFFLICLSACARKMSYADPKISVPVKLKTVKDKSLVDNNVFLFNKTEKANVIGKFNEIVNTNIKRIENFNIMNSGNISVDIFLKNAKNYINQDNIALIKNENVDLVITSPPYAGAQKYIRASSLNLGWTGLSNVKDLPQLNKESIGRESYNRNEYKEFIETTIAEANVRLHEIYKEYPLRSHIAGNYLNEMQMAFHQIYNSLKQGKFFILIAANNQVCGKEFLTQSYLKEIAIKLGFKIELELIDDIHSYGLMTKRNKTANVITREWITVFRK